MSNKQEVVSRGMDFMKYKMVYFLISLMVIVPGVVSLYLNGLKQAIDFTGGTLWEIRIESEEQINEIRLREVLGEETDKVGAVQQTEDSFVIRAKSIEEEEHQQIKAELEKKLDSVIEEVRFESVGPTLGRELFRKTIVAVVVATTMILLFIAWRFKNFKFGLAAIIAMLHDSLILVGAFSLLGDFFGVEVDTLFVTAVLTVLSFSVHDTIVVFDRVRETLRNHPTADFESVVNKSVAETLSRSVNNSMTIIFMLLALYLLGGETVKHFVLALLIGTVSGTYSSTFTAAPLLLVFEKFKWKSG